MTKKLYCWHTS